MPAPNSNWRKWIGVEIRKPVAIAELTHERLKTLSEDTALPMHYWANVAVRFFLAHTKAQRLIEAAKGVTLQEYYARTGGMETLVEMLLEETGSARELVKAGAPAATPPPPLRPAGYAEAPAPKPKPAPPKPPTPAQAAARARMTPEHRELAASMDKTDNGAAQAEARTG